MYSIFIMVCTYFIQNYGKVYSDFMITVMILSLSAHISEFMHVCVCVNVYVYNNMYCMCVYVYCMRV